MPFPIYLGWGLLLPACLSLLYGFSSQRAMKALGYVQKETFGEWLAVSCPTLVLFTTWAMVDIPLPVVYVLAFFLNLSWLLHGANARRKKMFFINLTHLTSMAFHMILLSIAALVSGETMRALLAQPLWRIAAISAVLAANHLTALLLPRWETVLGVLRTQTDSAEVRPFMVFLWFCNAFLLLDGILCIAPIDWRLLPLFLLGSTLLLEFYLVRFLHHLYTILKVRYLEAEHRQLMSELERQNQNAAVLRGKSVLDPMTGIFSRRYAVKQIKFFLQERAPFSLVFIDLDHLKQVNDKEGHHAGDLYLIRFVKEFGAYLQQTDIFARFGGDEFIVLLPGCGEERAAKQIETVRERMNGAFSFGVAAMQKEDGSAEEIIKRADQAMYRDKQKRMQ